MNQRLGRPAQDEFKLLCSSAGITCNSASEDDHGWDFLIEFESETGKNITADKLGGIRKALVQVKSTHGKIPKTRIKLSNAVKFSKDELPCFIVLFHYDANGENKIYVRHFWRELIERSLKRARQASVNNKDIHKLPLELSFAEHDDHSNDPIHWITSLILGFSAEYSTEKNSLSQTLGYEDRNYHIEVSIGPINGTEDIVDHFLGLTESLPVAKIRLVDSRFGIDAPQPIFESERGKIQIEPYENIKCNVGFQTSDGDSLSFEAIIKTPGILEVSREKFKAVVETWCFIIIVSVQEGIELNMKDSGDEKLPIEKLCQIAKFFSWGGKDVLIKFPQSGILPVGVWGRISHSGDEKLFSEISSVTEHLCNLNERAGFTQANYSWQEIGCVLRELSSWKDFLCGRNLRLGIRGKASVFMHMQIQSVIGYFNFKIAELNYFVLFDALVIEQSNKGDDVLFQCGARIVRHCYVGDDAEIINSAGMQSHQMELDSRDDTCLDLGDLRVGLDI